MKKILSYLLVLLTLVNSITPALAATTYTDSTEHVDYIEHSDEYDGTIVYAEIGSEFKVTIPKKVTLDGATKTGTYNVLVEGDIAGNEYVKVVPETYFLLYSKNKNSIPATVSQDRTGWSYLDFGIKANGLIETEGMTAGAWNGTFYFNIKLESSVNLDSSITGGTNNPDTGEETTPIVNATNITGAQKEQLLDALEESGQIKSPDNISTMINIKTPDNSLDGIEDITIDTTGVANPGDTVVIVQEKDNEWDYVSTETVTNNNEVKVPLKSTRPVSFVQTQPDGTVHVHKYTEDVISEATCTTNGTLSMMCECSKEYTFSIPASHNLIPVEKKDEDGNLINRYYECENCAYSILNLTQLFAGSELTHDCNKYLFTKYDSTNHWQECSICNKQYNKLNHNLIDNGWTAGTSTYCAENNVHSFICTCGYSYTNTNGRPAHDFYFVTNKNGRMEYYACKKCAYAYGYTNCYDAQGTLGCNNPGTCLKCGQTTNTAHWAVFDANTNNFYCGQHIVNNQKTNNVEVLAKLISQTVTYNNSAATVVSVVTLNYGSPTSVSTLCFTPNTKDIGTSYVVNGDTVTITQNIQFVSHYEALSNTSFCLYLDSQGTYIEKYLNLNPDIIAPSTTNISQSNLSIQNDWATSKQLIFSGTENYCNSVKLTLKDSNGNIYLNNVSASVTNNKWTYTCIPNIEASENGKTYILTVQDTLGNISTKEFTIFKTDKKAPIANNLSTPNKNWSQTKEVLFTAIDEGAGNVKIAFNNINEYVNMDKNGNTYTKEYQFSGDVYGEIMAAIYYTDAVGNVTTQFINVYNLDNTAPTISNVAINGKQITVTANDLNKQLNMEGSGVSKYALTWTSAPPQDSDWQDSNVLNVSTNGTYYIWVKDAVGNISECYQVRIIL